MEEQQPQSVSIVTEGVNSAPTITATGAWGGPTANGNAVIAYLFVESAGIPSIITAEADERGRLDPNKGERTQRGDITRQVQATLVLTPEDAVIIGQWLRDRGMEGIARRSQRPGDG